MQKDQRRAVRTALKDQKSDAGIYAFRSPTGAVWVGQSKTLASAENRLRFSLRTNGMAPADLTADWAAAQGEGFTFDVLERLDPELVPMARDDLLKARVLVRRADLKANAI
ncbi:MAG: GIY-YIG nuclease family protein [Rhodobacteraceae bacterium]|nr:GIY-YIG nuclease family protein [Paracoccaceae bacterium]